MSPISLNLAKKYALIVLFLIILIFGVLIAGILTSKPQTPLTTSISRQSVIQKLPYLTRDFTIVYSPDLDQIYINVISPPYQENRQKALDWLKSQGGDPKKLNIIYLPKSQFP